MVKKIFFRPKNNKIFFRLFIIYSTILFVLITLLIYSIGKMHFNALVNETDNTYRKIIESTKGDSIAAIGNADADVLRLLSNNIVSSFFADFYYDETDKRINRYNVINELKATCNNSQEIESISVYNLNSKYILNNSAGYREDEYSRNYGSEYEVLRWAVDNGVKNYSGIAGEDESLYIIRAYPMNSNEKYISGYLLMELNKNYVFRLFTENLPTDAKCCILNDDGTEIFSNFNSEERIADYIDDTAETSPQTVKIGSGKYTLFYDDAKIVPWRYVMLIETGKNSDVTKTLIVAEIAIGLLMFAFGVCMIYFASKSTCNPIDEFFERTAKRINKLGLEENANQSDRYSIESIELIMDKIIMDDQMMREEIRETLPSRKWNLMLKILSGDVKSFSEISAEAALLDIRLYEGSYAIMLSEIDTNDEEGDFAIYAPMICKRIEAVDGCMAVVNIGNRIIAFISSAVDGDELIEHIRDLTMKISHTTENVYNKKYNAGVSNVFTDLSKSKAAYEQALKCLDFDFVTQGGSLILYRDIVDYDDEVFLPFINKAIKIGEAIKNRNGKAAEETVNNIFEIMNGKHFPKQQLRYIIDIIRYEILETIRNMGISVTENIQEICSADIVFGNDMTEIRNKLVNEIMQIVEYVKDEVDNMLSKTAIEKVIEYVNKNYKSSSISIAELSSAMNISSTYITNGFKQFEGMSFYEYLTQLRMNEAGCLLLKTNKKIYEIAGEVGYTSSQSFIRSFKKYYGITPDKFRNNNSA